MNNQEKAEMKKKAFEALEQLNLDFPKDFDPDAELNEAYEERYGRFIREQHKCQQLNSSTT